MRSENTASRAESELPDFYDETHDVTEFAERRRDHGAVRALTPA